MDPLTLSATPKSWLLNSVLGPHAGSFVARLKHGRYSLATRRTYLGSLAHLARWMTQCCLPLRLLNERAVERFLDRHVPHCDCPRPVIRTRSDLRAACAHLLDVLREQHIIAERPREVGHIADELRRYDDYMRRVQGLIEGTRSGRLRIVQRLLLYKFEDRPVVIGELQPDDVRKFIAQQLDLRSTTSNATTVTSALRAYLRYRTSCGDRVHGLVGVIARPAHWSLAAALLPNRNRQPMTRSNVTQRLAIAVRAAAKNNAQLSRRPISPHTIRHTTAMHLLQSGVDISVIALWLGHESPTTTHNYVETDLAMKNRALARLQEPKTKMRRYRASDSLLEFLKGL